ncbi:hypothetical protein GQ44DRAFT_774687 [Phaeosphaeriaceae sp. PMI808]|nr:hypothetical protein GQ44DRAFT_774687 [Phaeosphaeriaceae sp. PMI808]
MLTWSSTNPTFEYYTAEILYTFPSIFFNLQPAASTYKLVIMKFYYYFTAFILGMTASAAPKELRRSSVGLPPGAYWETDSIIILPNDPITAKGLEEEDRLDSLEALSQIERSNDSNLATRADPKYWADIRMTGSKQPIGTLRGVRFYARLHECFSSLCKISDGKTSCWEQKKGDTPSCKIPNIISNYKKDGTYDSDNYLTVTFRAIKHSPKKTDLDLATYEMVAAVYRQMTLQNHNCYYNRDKKSSYTPHVLPHNFMNTKELPIF